MNGEDKKEKEKKAGNPIFILIIFIALLGFLYVIPEVYKNYNSNIAEFFGIGSSSSEEEPTGEEKVATSAYYQIGGKSTFTFNEITISDISLSADKILSMTITVDDTVDLDELDYYIEFFQNKKVFIGRRSLHGQVTRSLPIELDISNLDVDTTTYLIVSHISDSAIGSMESSSDESGLSSIYCVKGSESYEYEFYLKKLTKTTYKYSYTNVDLDAYSEELLAYQKKANTYNEYTGVTASVVENSSTFIFISEFDYTNVTSFSKIKDVNIFDKGTYNNVVKFKMDADGFECNE